MSGLYNEIEPYAAAWLSNLIAAGHIADGVVDDRSIVELAAADLVGRAQFHAFAGIGAWSYALRLAGWPDDAPVWTGSCPCQPFSAAGRRGGFDDARHLWPVWFELIRQCRPSVVFGEQVASPDGLEWFDAVSADLEGAGYAVGAADLCAAGIGAPHLRQRIYFVAHTHWMGDTGGIGAGRDSRSGDRAEATSEGERLVDRAQRDGTVSPGADDWSDAEWLDCTDGKTRPAQPGSHPLAHGSSTRMGSSGAMEAQPRTGILRAYGNAIVPQVAATFIRAAMGELGVAP